MTFFCLRLQNRKRVSTLRTDLHYWPTLELRRVYYSGTHAATAAATAGASGAGASTSTSTADGAAGAAEGVSALQWRWELIRHSTRPETARGGAADADTAAATGSAAPAKALTETA